MLFYFGAKIVFFNHYALNKNHQFLIKTGKCMVIQKMPPARDNKVS